MNAPNEAELRTPTNSILMKKTALLELARWRSPLAYQMKQRRRLLPMRETTEAGETLLTQSVVSLVDDGKVKGMGERGVHDDHGYGRKWASKYALGT